MAQSNWTGPDVVWANSRASTYLVPGSTPAARMMYAGIDPRYPPPTSAGLLPAYVGFMQAGPVVLMDQTPPTASNNAIATIQPTVAANTALTLVTSNSNSVTIVSRIIGPNNKVITPAGNVLAISGPYSPILVPGNVANTTITSLMNATQTSLTFAQATVFSPIVPFYVQAPPTSAGAAGEVMLVTALTTNNATVTRGALGTTAAAVANNAIITGLIQANPGGQNYGTGAAPVINFPEAVLFDPTKYSERCIKIISDADDSAITFIIRGQDGWGANVTNTISGANASAVYSTKAFAYIRSITPTANVTGNVTVGTSDRFGFPLRVDHVEDLMMWVNGAAITASAGYTAPDATSPATATTNATRGIYALQTASNGVLRVRMTMFLQPNNLAMTSENNFAALFGVPQV